MDNIYQDRIDYSTLPFVSREFFALHEDIVGYNLQIGDNNIKDGRFVFQTWAGPQADLFNLAHEIGHMVEIDDKRCHKPSWGFGYGKSVYIPGHGDVREGMITNQAVEREIRVFGIQLVIHEHFGIDLVKTADIWDDHDEHISQAYYMAKLCNWLDGFWLYKPKRDESKANQTGYHTEREEAAYQTITARILEERNKWSYEEVLAEWDRKMSLLRTKKKRGVWENYH